MKTKVRSRFDMSFREPLKNPIFPSKWEFFLNLFLQSSLLYFLEKVVLNFKFFNLPKKAVLF